MTATSRCETNRRRLSVSRGEWIWLSLAIICGGILRFGNLQQVAVEHYDEAVYSSNLRVPAESGGEYPFRQLYAPPLLPLAIELMTVLSQITFGVVPSWWVALPALICGLATIPSAWWIARQWFSRQAGVIAALLVAFQEFHAAYSRTALTDVPVSLFVLWAVHWFWKALQTGLVREAVIAGLFTASAWWTKYNGWLPLAIAASGGVAWQMMLPRRDQNWPRLAKVGFLGAVTAYIAWLPVLWDCQKVGGYSVVAANHRGYVDGISKWLPNAIQGFRSLEEFVGWPSLAGLLLAAGMLFIPQRFTGIGLSEEQAGGGKLLAGWLTAAWFWGLMVAVPLYHPYPRLWMPWAVSACIVAAAAADLCQWRPHRRLTHWFRGGLGATTVLVIAVLLMQCVHHLPQAGIPVSFEDRTSFLAAAKRIQEHVRSRDNIIAVFPSDPASWYHLLELGLNAGLNDRIEAIQSTDANSVYLVVGPMSAKDSKFRQEWDRLQDRFELVEEMPLRLSRIVILDLFSPQELDAHPELRIQPLRLYRSKRR